MQVIGVEVRAGLNGDLVVLQPVVLEIDKDGLAACALVGSWGRSR